MCIRDRHTRAEKDLDLTEYLGLTKEEYQIFLAQGNQVLKDLLDSQRVFRRFCIYQLCLGETQTVPFAFKQLDALRKACLLYTSRLYAVCHSRFFIACKPERALRINQNGERQGMDMNVKQKRKQNGRRVKPAHSTDWKMKRQAVSALRPRNVAPMARAVILPRRSRRGI